MTTISRRSLLEPTQATPVAFDVNAIARRFADVALTSMRKGVYRRQAEGQRLDMTLVQETHMGRDYVNLGRGRVQVRLDSEAAVRFTSRDMQELEREAEGMGEVAARELLAAIDFAVSMAETDEMDRCVLAFVFLPTPVMLDVGFAEPASHDASLRAFLGNDLHNGEYFLEAQALFGVRWIKDPARQ